jgi:hypothetical protein
MIEKTIKMAPSKIMDQRKVVESLIKDSLGKSVFINDVRKVNSRENLYLIGITIDKYIEDYEKPSILKFIQVKDLLAIRSVKKINEIKIEMPSREDIQKRYLDRKKELILRSENILINEYAGNFVKIPYIQIGLNPIKQIFVSLLDFGSITLEEIFSSNNRKKERTRKYIDFLENTDFIIVDGGEIFPGEEFHKYDLSDIRMDENLLLKDVLIRGFRFINEELRIRILTPYLEYANAYYLQSHYADEILKMHYKEIYRHYNEMYSRNKQFYKVYADLKELSKNNILVNNGEVFSGTESTLDLFRQKAIA